MALIYRSVFEVVDEQGTFVERSADVSREWLSHKLRTADFVLPDAGVLKLENPAVEITVSGGTSAECVASRIQVFESARDDGAEVKTTFTAISGGGRSWGWVDLERWRESGPAWIPIAPGILTAVIKAEDARRGGTSLWDQAELLEGEAGELAAQAVMDPARVIPLVLVSYEKSDGVAPAVERGRELSKRLTGIANVIVLLEGAVTSFSRAMLEAVGPNLDVHSGAARTYLPGLGQPGDYPARHRYVPFRQLLGRRADIAASIIAPPLVRRAIETPPPSIWREHARALVAGSDGDYPTLLDAAEQEIDSLEERIASLEVAVNDYEGQLAAEKESGVAILRQVSDLGRRNAFLTRRLRELGEVEEADSVERSFEPQFCSEVVEEARKRFDRIVIHPSVDEAAGDLDAHLDESWAAKAWQALQALQAYAEAKADGAFRGDFGTFCAQSVSAFIIPTSWIARSETKLTMSNARFRELRNLPVSTEVAEDGRIIMEQHIKIEQGGTPCPRLHFHDDTMGTTGNIHVGWFGDHLDSRAKS